MSIAQQNISITIIIIIIFNNNSNRLLVFRQFGVFANHFYFKDKLRSAELCYPSMSRSIANYLRIYLLWFNSWLDGEHADQWDRALLSAERKKNPHSRHDTAAETGEK